MIDLSQLPLLSLLIWTPILGGVWILYAGPRQHGTARYLSFILSSIVFILALLMYFNFDVGQSSMQFVEKKVWIDLFNINYHLGIDGLSLMMILLNCFITIIAICSSFESIEKKLPQYLAAFMILAGCMNGVFAALDSILFYVFWEALLIPMFLIIGIWGGPNRVYATIKFFLYTFLGSVFMLVAFVYMYVKGGSFYIPDLQAMELSLREQTCIFLAFFLAFAVKIPMWPVHTWLPDAHVEAPTAGSVVLAAVMLKLGGYGFLRFSLPVTPDASANLAELMIIISLVAIVYIGFVALVQKDMKKLIAYSSISHMGFVTLGLFSCFVLLENQDSREAAVTGLQGAMFQMISHGFISAAMFLCVGVLYDRMHSREISSYGGVVNTMPKFAAFMMLFAMANAGLPGTSGFVGEFLVIISSFEASAWIAFFASMTLILGAAYTLWMYKRVIFGQIQNEEVEHLKDINTREMAILSSLAFFVLLFGIWPAPLIETMNESLSLIVEQVSQSKLGIN